MKKRIERIGLSVILVLALVSVSNATLTWTLVDENGGSIEISDTVLITVSSDVGEEITWGVYLDPTSDYPSNSQLQNATMLAAAGNQATVTGADPGSGHDYTSLASGGPVPGAGAWSTVQFVGNAAGTWTVELTAGAGGGGTQLATADITVVPEPATIALLGLGGMFLLRRRR